MILSLKKTWYNSLSFGLTAVNDNETDGQFLPSQKILKQSSNKGFKTAYEVYKTEIYLNWASLIVLWILFYPLSESYSLALSVESRASSYYHHIR